MNRPLVSVIIPIYNTEQYIAETIESAINQTYPAIEIIALNDGSKDNSLQIVQQLAAKYSQIKIIDKPNTGVSDTRNRGIAIATGEFIALLDADDVWELDKIEKQVQTLQNNPNYGWCFSLCTYIDAHGKFIEGFNFEAPSDNQFKELITWKSKSFPGLMSNLLVRKNFLGDTKFNTKISSPADKDFAIKLAKKGDAFFMNKKLWRYRQHGSNMASNYKKVIDEMELMYKIYVEEGFFKDVKEKKETLSSVYRMLGVSSIKGTKQYLKGTKFILQSLYYKLTSNL